MFQFDKTDAALESLELAFEILDEMEISGRQRRLRQLLRRNLTVTVEVLSTPCDLDEEEK